MIDMKHLFTTALFSLAVLSALAQSTETLLLEGWKFQRGTSEGAQVASYNDSHWQPVTIPHDWALQVLSIRHRQTSSDHHPEWRARSY